MNNNTYLPITADAFISEYKEEISFAGEVRQIRAELEEILAGLSADDELRPMISGMLQAKTSTAYFRYMAGALLTNVRRTLELRQEEQRELDLAQRWLREEFKTVMQNIHHSRRVLLEHLVAGFRRWYHRRTNRPWPKADARPDATQNRIMVLPPREFLTALQRVGVYSPARSDPKTRAEAEFSAEVKGLVQKIKTEAGHPFEEFALRLIEALRARREELPSEFHDAFLSAITRNGWAINDAAYENAKTAAKRIALAV
jgi:hypothetical protein